MRAGLRKPGGYLAGVLMIACMHPRAAASLAQEQQPADAQHQEAAARADPAEPSEAPRRPSRRSGRTSRRQASPPVTTASREARSSRAAGPVQQDLTLSASLVGGYDDNLIGRQGTSALLGRSVMASGSMGRLDTALTFLRGNRRHSMSVDATGNVLTYPSYLERPAVGGSAAFDVMSTFGRDTTLRASQRVSTDPFFNVFQGSVGEPAPTSGVVQASPVTGLFERRSLGSRSAVSTEHPWGRRDSTTFSYAYGVRQFTEDDAGDSTTHSVSIAHERTLSTGVSARAAYQYLALANVGADSISRSTFTHRVEGGADVEHGLSRRRLLTMTVLGGAAHIESVGSRSLVPYRAWIPTGAASARLVLSPSWHIEGSYRRDFALLQGITNEVYATDTVSLTTGGLLMPRVDVLVGGTYGNWRAPVASGIDSRFEVYGTVTQVHVRLSRTVTAIAAYNYYHHRYSDPADLPAGFPSKYDRHAVRFGIGLLLPVLGARTARSPVQR